MELEYCRHAYLWDGKNGNHKRKSETDGKGMNWTGQYGTGRDGTGRDGTGRDRTGQDETGLDGAEQLATLRNDKGKGQERQLDRRLDIKLRQKQREKAEIEKGREAIETEG